MCVSHTRSYALLCLHCFPCLLIIITHCMLCTCRRPPPAAPPPGSKLFTKASVGRKNDATKRNAHNLWVSSPRLTPHSLHHTPNLRNHPPHTPHNTPQPTTSNIKQQEEDVMSWDGDELTRIHNLHVREFKDLGVSWLWWEAEEEGVGGWVSGCGLEVGFEGHVVHLSGVRTHLQLLPLPHSCPRLCLRRGGERECKGFCSERVRKDRLGLWNVLPARGAARKRGSQQMAVVPPLTCSASQACICPCSRPPPESGYVVSRPASLSPLPPYPPLPGTNYALHSLTDTDSRPPSLPPLLSNPPLPSLPPYLHRSTCSSPTWQPTWGCTPLMPCT